MDLRLVSFTTKGELNIKDDFGDVVATGALYPKDVYPWELEVGESYDLAIRITWKKPEPGEDDE